MKKNLSIPLLFILVFNQINLISSQSNTVVTNADLQHVTVFNKGANIERSGNIDLKQGSNEIIIKDVSPALINESIQIVVFSNQVIINSVQKKMNYLGKIFQNKEISLLSDSLLKLKSLVQDYNIKLEVFKQEKDLLIQNKSVLKLSKEFIIDDLMDLTDYFRERMLDVETNLSTIKFTLNNLNNEIRKVQNQINSQNVKANNEFSNIVIQLTSKSEGNFNYNISYNINNAGWVPFYDIRSKMFNSPISLTYKAKVFQHSNELWDNVNLSLSTGNLNESNKAPTFNTNFIFYNNHSDLKKKEKSIANNNYSTQKIDLANEALNSESKEEESLSASDFTTIAFNGTQIEYTIALPYSISSTKQPILIDIQQITLPATYDYYCYPKIDKDVFLMCHFKSLSEYNLLPGDGQIYFKGKSIGKTYIDPFTTKSINDISLGRDAKVIVERKILKKMSSEVKIGDKIKLERSYEISMKNNKNDSIQIKLIDQIPVSNNKSISVELVEKTDASYNKLNGKLSWNINLNPQQTIRKQFNYVVKYPDNKIINGLN
jgi:uncharacterized protein (TIGR02231 family)